MAKTSNEEILDAMIRHQIYLLRYSGYVRNRMISILNKSEEELARRIRDKLSARQGSLTSAHWRRLQSLQKSIQSIRTKSWKEASQVFKDEMLELTSTESIFLSTIVEASAPTVLETVLPAPRQLRAIALSRPFEGRILKDWAQKMADDDIRRIHSAVQAGMVEGLDSASIARRVVGSSTLNGTDGITQMTRRQVQTVVRTAVNHVSNNARMAWMSDNAELMTAEIYIATLDSKTTAVCRANDGKTFEQGKGPQPPLHFNCRSTRAGVLDGGAVGERPFKASTEKMLVKEYADANDLGNITSRDALPYGTKDSFDNWSRKRIRDMTGRVPASTTYNEWLTGQSAKFQDEILGNTKARLFRKGGLSLDKFVDHNGTELTLKDLARKHGEAFKAAGLEAKEF